MYVADTRAGVSVGNDIRYARWDVNAELRMSDTKGEGSKDEMRQTEEIRQGCTLSCDIAKISS